MAVDLHQLAIAVPTATHRACSAGPLCVCGRGTVCVVWWVVEYYTHLEDSLMQIFCASALQREVLPVPGGPKIQCIIITVKLV